LIVNLRNKKIETYKRTICASVRYRTYVKLARPLRWETVGVRPVSSLREAHKKPSDARRRYIGDAGTYQRN